MSAGALLAATLAVVAGAAVQGSVGFGLGLIAVPLLVLIDPRFVPGPVLCVAIVLTLLLSHRERASIDFFGVAWGLAGRLPGTVLGAAALVIIPKERLAVAFGALILFAVGLSALPLRLRPTAGSLASAGLLSGFMATTAAIGGPPMALLLQHEAAARLRGTLSGYFLVGATISLIALMIVGRFGPEELVLASALLPGILLGFAVSYRTAPILDRGYTRPAVLAMATIAALGAILRDLL